VSTAPHNAPYTIVLVRWADAHGDHNGWVELEELDNDDGEYIVETVGFLVPLDEPGAKKGHVNLVQTYADGDAIGLFHIPVGMVRKFTKLT
jgi:hypothetical protein